MEPSVNQMRGRFSGVGQEKTEDSGSFYGRRIQPQKTESFKEKRKTQNWFQRRLSGQTSRDYDASNAMKHATAVGAAAIAIKSIEDSAISDEKKTGYERKPTLERIKSGKEETTISKPEPRRFSKIFSGSTKRTPEQVVPHGPRGWVPTSIATTGKNPEKAVLPAPSIKKTPTFADKQSNSAGGVNPETAAPKPNLSTSMKPESPWNETERPSSTGPGTKKTRADIWEETEIARLKERYEKQNAKILAWENKKKKKSTNHLHKIESERERKRAKALQKSSSETEIIKKIAEGARAEAEEKHRKEVLKVKEKANAMRRTGKAPKTCFCL